MTNISVHVSAPGKVILFGEHAVVYGKTALATSLTSLRSHVKISLFEKPIFELLAPCIGIDNFSLDISNIELKFPLEDLENPKLDSSAIESLKKLTENISVISCLYMFLYMSQIAKLKYKGIRIELESGLPIGAGLGSSAAFSVSLVTALLIATGLVNKEKLSVKEDEIVKGKVITDERVLEMINRWAFLIETLIHGTPSGIDNSVSTFGGVLSLTSGKIKRIERYEWGNC